MNRKTRSSRSNNRCQAIGAKCSPMIRPRSGVDHHRTSLQQVPIGTQQQQQQLIAAQPASDSMDKQPQQLQHQFTYDYDVSSSQSNSSGSQCSREDSSPTPNSQTPMNVTSARWVGVGGNRKAWRRNRYAKRVSLLSWDKSVAGILFSFFFLFRLVDYSLPHTTHAPFSGLFPPSFMPPYFFFPPIFSSYLYIPLPTIPRFPLFKQIIINYIFKYFSCRICVRALRSHSTSDCTPSSTGVQNKQKFTQHLNLSFSLSLYLYSLKELLAHHLKPFIIY